MEKWHLFFEGGDHIVVIEVEPQEAVEIFESLVVDAFGLRGDLPKTAHEQFAATLGRPISGALLGVLHDDLVHAWATAGLSVDSLLSP